MQSCDIKGQERLLVIKMHGTYIHIPDISRFREMDSNLTLAIIHIHLFSLVYKTLSYCFLEFFSVFSNCLFLRNVLYKFIINLREFLCLDFVELNFELSILALKLVSLIFLRELNVD